MHPDERAESLPPGRRPRTSFEAIARRSEGLVALSGCLRGEVPWLAALGRSEEALGAARRWREVFGAGFAVEIANHLGPGGTDRNRVLPPVAAHLRPPV